MNEILTQDSLCKSAATLKDWCVSQALPLWEKQAKRKDDSWVEHLHLGGSPDVEAERRWRVLARQVYVYAKSTSLGWYDGLETAEDTYRKMKSVGWVHRVNAGGDITNDMQDLYDLAFYILAASSLFAITKNSQYLRDAEELLAWIEVSLKHPSGGWKETSLSTNSDERRQNPHMHLLEASLFLHSVTKDLKHLQPAKKVFSLFRKYFFDNGTVSEFFESDWTLLPGKKGQTAEPGHAMEWIWLLGQYNKATGAKVASFQNALYDRSLNQRGYFLHDEEDKSGDIRRETTRLWVQTEVIKAHLAMAENNIPGAREMAAALIDALFPTFLTADGKWNDQINACGANIAKTIPVSTFYHILCMAAEADRISNIAPNA